MLLIFKTFYIAVALRLFGLIKVFVVYVFVYII